MANETLGASFQIDVTDLKAGLAQANRLIRESESEFKAAAAGMDDWSSSEDGLNAKISSLNNITEIQRKKVNALQSEYDRLIADGLDPASKEATELRTKINNETAALNKNEAEAKKLSAALEEMGNDAEEAGGAAENMGGKLGGLQKVGGLAVKAVAAVGAACVSAVGAFFGLAESTREARENMAMLETSFSSAGLSAEAAENTFTELYGILGDEGTATEAAQQLAKMSQDEADLAANTRILTGVMAEYGDSIPTEGLAEGMAATAAMGEVQGVLADALEWQGVNLEDYNAKLATLATEEERAAYIQQTLTDLYGESADAYRENNAEVIAAQEAQARLNQAMNDLGAIAEPIMTTLKQLAADLLVTILPFVQLMGEGLAGALNGTAGAADNLAAGLSGIITTLLDQIIALLPFVIETIVAVIPQLLTALLAQLPTILSTLLDMVSQVISALGAMLPDIVRAIVAVIPQLITSLVSAIPQLLQAAVQLLLAIVQAIPVIVQELSAALPSVINTVIDVLINSIPVLTDGATTLLMAIVDAIPTIITSLTQNLPQIITSIVNGLIRAIPQVLAGAVQLLGALIKAIPQIASQLISSVPQLITAIVNGLKGGMSSITAVGGDIVRGLWNGISNLTSWIANKIRGFCSNALDSIKDFFGIHSPSKVMADEVGKNLALGIGEGFEQNMAGVNKQIIGAMDFVGGSGQVGSTRGGAGVVVYQTNNYAQAHSRLELYKTKQATAAAVRLAMAGA